MVAQITCLRVPGKESCPIAIKIRYNGISSPAEYRATVPVSFPPIGPNWCSISRHAGTGLFCTSDFCGDGDRTTHLTQGNQKPDGLCGIKPIRGAAIRRSELKVDEYARDADCIYMYEWLHVYILYILWKCGAEASGQAGRDGGNQRELPPKYRPNTQDGS
jgi:hypothetical protein